MHRRSRSHKGGAKPPITRLPNLNDFVKGKSINSVRSVLEKDTSGINVADKKGNTPLLNALSIRYYDIVPLLLHYGADVNPVNNDGKTPLYYAAINNQLNIIKDLVEYGADTLVLFDGKDIADNPNIANDIRRYIREERASIINSFLERDHYDGPNKDQFLAYMEEKLVKYLNFILDNDKEAEPEFLEIVSNVCKDSEKRDQLLETLKKYERFSLLFTDEYCEEPVEAEVTLSTAIPIEEEEVSNTGETPKAIRLPETAVGEYSQEYSFASPPEDISDRINKSVNIGGKTKNRRRCRTRKNKRTLRKRIC